MHRSRILKHAFSSVLQAAATLTGFEPNLKFSRLCAIPLQTCSMLRVRGQNTNQAVCTNRAELRSSSVRICPKKQMQPVAASSLWSVKYSPDALSTSPDRARIVFDCWKAHDPAMMPLWSLHTSTMLAF